MRPRLCGNVARVFRPGYDLPECRNPEGPCVTVLPATNVVIADWTERLRTLAPDVAAVVLRGSHARGNATIYSDIDVDVLTTGERDPSWPVSIDERDGVLYHVSVALTSVASWLAEEQEPESYGFGLPIEVPIRVLWTADPRLAGKTALHHPPGTVELEDAVSSYGKILSRRRFGTRHRLALATQELAGYVPGLLQPLHPHIVASDRASALDAALGFTNVPDGYRDDLLACQGLAAAPSSPDALVAAAGRLITGSLDVMRAHIDAYRSRLEPNMIHLLETGMFDRLIAQWNAEHADGRA